MVRKVFGIPLSSFVSRTLLAVLYGGVTLLVFYEIPDLFLNKAIPASYTSSLPLAFGSTDLLYYAGVITVLSGLQIIFEGGFLGDAAAVSNGISQVFYIYIVANGGYFQDYIQSAGISVSLDFRAILYLMMIPSALTIVSTILAASTRTSTRRSDLLYDIELG